MAKEKNTAITIGDAIDKNTMVMQATLDTLRLAMLNDYEVPAAETVEYIVLGLNDRLKELKQLTEELLNIAKGSTEKAEAK